MITSGPRGTYDILPEDSVHWQAVETVMCAIAELYGFSEIRIPIFEHTELFERGVGDTTDIVQKEMYTFKDRGDRSLTLRPEGTASCARVFIQHKIFNQAQPTKWYYMGPMFRYDRPQAGRYRQFHQFGVEAFGSDDPTVDAEVITLMVHILQAMGIKEYELHLNTVGCPVCRPLYRERLLVFLEPRAGELCNDCRQRLAHNPLRVLDCKNRNCQEGVTGFPRLSQYLCEHCGRHFEAVKDTLALYQVSYILDDQLVRGLDYYTNTAFEIILPGTGAQNAVGGGGRYNGLIEACGGPPTPGIGFALGMERLLSARRQQKLLEEKMPPALDVFIAVNDHEFDRSACRLLHTLRQAGIRADKDYLGRSLKAQMKHADRVGARLVAVIGEEEEQGDFYTLRDMEQKEQYRVPAVEMVNRIQTILIGS